LTPFARETGIGLINASGLHMGVLSGRDAPAWHPAPVEVLQAARKAADICRLRGADISKAAIRFCLDHPYVASTLVGMSTPDEVRTNLELMRIQSDPRLITEIRAAIGPALNYAWPSGRPENDL
jgi:L-galactose dehydrogenase